ncbi:hypothetical protein D3C73_1177680 [compost metagenome]
MRQRRHKSALLQQSGLHTPPVQQLPKQRKVVFTQGLQTHCRSLTQPPPAIIHRRLQALFRLASPGTACMSIMGSAGPHRTERQELLRITCLCFRFRKLRPGRDQFPGSLRHIRFRKQLGKAARQRKVSPRPGQTALMQHIICQQRPLLTIIYLLLQGCQYGWISFHLIAPFLHSSTVCG